MRVVRQWQVERLLAEIAEAEDVAAERQAAGHEAPPELLTYAAGLRWAGLMLGVVDPA